MAQADYCVEALFPGHRHQLIEASCGGPEPPPRALLHVLPPA